MAYGGDVQVSTASDGSSRATYGTSTFNIEVTHDSSTGSNQNLFQNSLELI